MAITPLTGFKAFRFDGEESTDYGVAILGEGVFNAPERDVEMITIPGRNGQFALDNGRFENIEVTYPANLIAGNTTDFATALSDFRNMLCSKKGYCRLEDDYHPDEYRMAVYKEGLEVDEKALRAGEFTITFDCKPQRWLTSGEVPVTIGEIQDEVGTDSEPYLFRASPQFSDSYVAEQDEIVGGTVAWNQLTPTHTGISTLPSGLSGSVSNGYIDVSGTASVDGYFEATPSANTIPANHVCLIMCEGYGGFTYSRTGFSNNTTGAGCINKHTADWSGTARIKVYANTTYNIKARFTSFDLTQMFGSEIADYLYTLESGTAGAGVAKLKSWGFFDKPYYAYNAGELKSVSGLVSHDMTGFNQWDEEWEAGGIGTNTGANATFNNAIRSKNYIQINPNMTYYGNFPSAVYPFFYDANKNYLGFVGNGNTLKGNTFTIKNLNNSLASGGSFANACYMRFRCDVGSTYADDICINISWDGSRDGEYEPYELHSYPLDTDLTLRGIPKLDANNSLYYDGDVYEADGTVTRKYGVVDLGSLSWNYDSSVPRLYSTDINSTVKKPSAGSVVANVICAKYPTTYADKIYGAGTNNIVAISTGGAINVKDTSYTSVVTFKTAMSGVYLVYELATPTTETADPYQHIQVCDPYGTEEYVSTSIVPVGHNTKYGQNPYVLDNPTLFESSPLLEIEGYGSIGFNGYDIELENVEIGNIPVTKTQAGNVYTLGGLSELAIGDEINIDSFAFTYEFVFNNQTLTSGGRGSGVTGSIFYITAEVDTHSVRLNLKFGPSNNRKFIYGTAETKAGSGYLTFNSLSLTVKVNASLAYDGDSTITFSYTPQTTITPTSSQLISQAMGDVSAYSTKPYDFGVIFCDTDIGEFYRIEGGEYISMNHVGDLGSDLPTLAPGTNTVTYDNTITELNITPRWWKI